MNCPCIPTYLSLILSLFSFLQTTSSLHHLKRDPVQWVNERDSTLPLTVTNLCQEDIYPAILTQGGTGPSSSGFLLRSGETNAQTVSLDWKGRVWGRTNCTFADSNSNTTNPASFQGGQACTTGDCGPFVECPGAGNPPATLAEFTMSSNTGQCFYDLSLVDGYNLPVGIIYLGQASNSSDADPDIPPNLTNPMCVGTAALLPPQGDNSTDTFSTNSTYVLPLDQAVSNDFVQGWCPWPLQQSPPQKPGDGVYPYPDDNIQRPLFNPCLSACAKWGDPQYCCTGSHGSPDKCQPSLYSTQAKAVCPDAYSYAFDDQTSTFIIPQGGGFEVVFCPPSRSTNILEVFGDQLHQLASTGMVSRSIKTTTQNKTYIAERNEGSSSGMSPDPAIMAFVVGLAVACMASSWL